MIIFTPNSVIKSSDVNANFNGLQTGTDINSGAITPDKLSIGAGYAEVATSETLTNTTYTDLTTPGPSATVTVPASGKVYIAFGAQITVGTSGNGARVGYEVSGANTIAVNDGRVLRAVHSATTATNVAVSGILSGLTSGSSTFKLVYRSGPSGSATFANRHITVIPIS